MNEPTNNTGAEGFSSCMESLARSEASIGLEKLAEYTALKHAKTKGWGNMVKSGLLTFPPLRQKRSKMFETMQKMRGEGKMWAEIGGLFGISERDASSIYCAQRKAQG
jgi:hypothetical protein